MLSTTFTAVAFWVALLTLLAVPLVTVAVDSIAGLRARRRHFRFSNQRNSDFTVLVPIWGDMRYLENVEYLSQYGGRVILCTTGDENAAFYAALDNVAAANGFRVFRDRPTRATSHRADTHRRRATSGTIRDRVIRDALRFVTTPYVVPLDADSVSITPLDFLVGELAARGEDLASVRLVPRNRDTVLARLQHFEYRLAMQFRMIAPWMLSGACHMARTEVLRDVMDRHSLFFQGNDVETGLIARARGYRVGHIPFQVLTTVPATPKAWLRQRLAWSGGEFRLFIVNVRFLVRHPFLWVYGGLLTIAAFPLRWLAVGQPGWPLAVVAGLYVLLALVLHRRSRSAWVLLVPLYTLAYSLILTPLGLLWYAYMAVKHTNGGVIRPHRAAAAG